MIRIGHGYDAHRFEDDTPENRNTDKHIVIGGEKIAYPLCLIAHSDGDVLVHALCDALLGAIGAGDIGKHFPDTDEAYRRVDSRKLLENVMSFVFEKGFSVNNADMTIIAQAPKMAPHIEAMRKNLSADLRVAPDQVNIKATTTEKMGFTGRKEGIAAHAVVLLTHKH